MPKPTSRKIVQAVADVARVASAMFDGELCSQIVTERSWKWFADFDPDDKWSAHDNYDVEHGPFVAAKKTLVRLERLAPEGVALGCSLWLPVPTLPGRATCVVQNGGPARWQQFGTLHVEITDHMRRALEAGEFKAFREARAAAERPQGEDR